MKLQAVQWHGNNFREVKKIFPDAILMDDKTINVSGHYKYKGDWVIHLEEKDFSAYYANWVTVNMWLWLMKREAKGGTR